MQNHEYGNATFFLTRFATLSDPHPRAVVDRQYVDPVKHSEDHHYLSQISTGLEAIINALSLFGLDEFPTVLVARILG